MSMLESLRCRYSFFKYVLTILKLILSQVHIDNFMCHSQFTWEPNQRVNFVTGANGSGKSSMLQVLKFASLILHRFHDNDQLSGDHSWFAR